MTFSKRANLKGAIQSLVFCTFTLPTQLLAPIGAPHDAMHHYKVWH